MIETKLDAIEAGDKISKQNVFTGDPHESTVRQTPRSRGYPDGTPYAVWQRTQDNRTKVILYDPQTEYFAVCSTSDEDGVWFVSSVGTKVVGDHKDHTDDFDERGIEWWVDEAYMEIVHGAGGFYADGSYGINELSPVDGTGRITIAPVAK